MAADVAVLIAKLEADVRGFDRDIRKAEKRIDGLDRTTKDATRSQKNLNRGVAGLGGTMRTVFAGAAAVAAGRFMLDTISSASDLEESINAVEVTFGPAAEGIKRLGEAASKNVGLANAEFNALAVGFSAFVDKIDDGGGNVAGIMDDLTTRIADFASVMNLEVAEAGEKFRSGLAGETEPLRQFGIDVSAAAVNAKALELGLADSSAALTEQDKILARYNLIMEQTNKTAGDFANTSDSVANQQRILKAEFENAKAELGAAFLPAMSAFLDVLIKIVPHVETFANALGAMTGSLDMGAVAFKNWAKEHGKAPETVKEMTSALIEEADARRNWVDAILFGLGPAEQAVANLKDHIETTEMSTGQLEEWRDAIDAAGEANELTAHGVEELHDVIDKQLSKSVDESADAVLKATAATGKWGEATDKTERSVSNLNTEIRAEIRSLKDLRAEQLAAVSPAFAMIRAYDDWQDSLTTATDTAKEYGATSREARDANMEVIESFGGLIGAADEYAQQSGIAVQEAVRQLGREAGLAEDQIQTIIDALNAVDGFQANAGINIKVSTDSATVQVGSVSIQPGETAFVGDGFVARQHGGPFAANQPMVVGEHGPEMVSFGRSGHVTSNQNMPSGGANVVYNFEFSGPVGSQTELERWVRTALAKHKRRNGPHSR